MRKLFEHWSFVLGIYRQGIFLWVNVTTLVQVMGWMAVKRYVETV